MVEENPKGHILVVDDESAIRMFVHNYLTHKGCSITVAANGEKALEIYQRCSNKSNKPPAYCPIDLVLTDMGMTPMNGYELFNKLITINPEAKICVMTGDSGRYAREIEEMKSNGLVGVVQKPFTPTELDDVINNCLDSKS